MRSAALVPATSPGSPAGAVGGFLRVELDVSEQRLTRSRLALAIANTGDQLGRWRPDWLRWHVGCETLVPAARRAGNGLRGMRANIQYGVVALGAPTFVGSGAQRKGLWANDIPLSAKPRAAVARPDACAARLLSEQAQLRLDAIANHLNFLGIHDEYVPAHRFKALHDTALRLAERATVLEGRYLQFKDRAEVETLNQAESAQLAELATASREIAAERAREAQINVDMARAQVGAAGSALTDARATSRPVRPDLQDRDPAVRGPVQLRLQHERPQRRLLVGRSREHDGRPGLRGRLPAAEVRVRGEASARRRAPCASSSSRARSPRSSS